MILKIVIFPCHVKLCDLRLLLDLYTCTRLKVRTTWKQSNSDYFKTTNDIRQGGIASPVLFCTYLDGIIEALRKEDAGCWIGHQLLGIFVYADDIVLLSPSANGLKRMLNVCHTYAYNRGIKFNPSKSVCMKFGDVKGRAKYPVLEVNGAAMTWVEEFRYLGVHLTRDLSERSDVGRKRADLFGRTNGKFCQHAKDC